MAAYAGAGGATKTAEVVGIRPAAAAGTGSSTQAVAAEGSTGPGGRTVPKKYDFSHLSLEEIDEELGQIGANLERDMEKLKKQCV